jgi:hypothetical protein
MPSRKNLNIFTSTYDCTVIGILARCVVLHTIKKTIIYSKIIFNYFVINYKQSKSEPNRSRIPSNNIDISYGVPQGSILTSLLFQLM